MNLKVKKERCLKNLKEVLEQNFKASLKFLENLI